MQYYKDLFDIERDTARDKSYHEDLVSLTSFGGLSYDISESDSPELKD
jgi:hypothetical protein